MKTKLLLSILLLVVGTGIASSNRKTDLLASASGCNVTHVKQHNSFSVVNLVCKYASGNVTGLQKKTLYVSRSGYIYK